MLSRRQKTLNRLARYVQKPLLALIRPQWLARRVFSLNAATLYHRPSGLGLTHRTLVHDDHKVPATLCTLGDGPGRGTLLYIHGGAFVIGNLRGYRHLVATLAGKSGLTGVYVDYRLAPEHPAPAALDDVTTAYCALVAEAPDRPIAIAGDSAGGNLALALLHRILDRDLPRPACLVALSPITDLSLTNRSLMLNRHSDVLVPHSWGERGVRDYLAGQDPKTPELSPILGTFTGAPPVLIHTDTTETLHDDARLMADRLRAQGVAVSLRETTGEPHVNHLNLRRAPEADAAVAHVADFLRRHTGG